MKTKIFLIFATFIFAFGDTLSDSVELYNSGKYYNAYQKLENELLNHLSDKEYNYQHALSAKKVNKNNEAIASFERCLDIDENFYKARLELAKLYFQIGLYEQSENEFLVIYNSQKTPVNVKINIKTYLDSIEQKLKKNSFSGMLLVGIVNDDNVLNGNELIGTSFGTTKQGIAQNYMLSLNYEINTRTAIDYLLNMSYYNKSFFDYDLQNIGIEFWNFGVLFKTKGDQKFSIPFKYSTLKYGGVDLLEMYDIQISTNANLERFKSTTIYASYNYTLHDATNSAVNKSSTKYKFGSYFMINDANVVGLDYAVERQVYSGRTDIDNDSYSLFYTTAKEIKENTILKSTLSYKKRNDLYATAGSYRRDDMLKLVLNPTYKIDKRNSWMLNLSFTKNISNILAYDYDKNEITLNYIHTISKDKIEKFFDFGALQ